jgi:hypothetical protein
MRVYHFLDSRFALDDLQNHHLKIARLEDLNDPFDLMAPELRSTSARRAHQAFLEMFSTLQGVICFSRTWHNPLLWSHYADKHRGICFGFDVPNKHIAEVTYSPKRLLDDAQHLFGRYPDSPQIYSRLLTTKFIDWKYEDEVRVVVKFDHIIPIDGRYFLDFNDYLRLRQVILGPRYHGSVDEIKQLTLSAGLTVSVIKARLAFRSFKVVADRRSL